jgi:Domain of unknown function (DUF4783)
MLLMMKKKFFLIFFINLILSISNIAFAQQNFSTGRSESKEQNDMPLSIFNRLESAISTGSVSEISRYLNSQTYLSLSSGVSGYYSSNQAFYILEDFISKIFKQKKICLMQQAYIIIFSGEKGIHQMFTFL